MNREVEENNKKTLRSDAIHIPLDLTGEILSRLPVKSTVRFQCISKPWSSLITDSIMTWSLAKPRLLVISRKPWFESSVFSLSGCLLNTYKEPISTELDNPFDHGLLCYNKRYTYTHGLICLHSSCNQFMIYNPTTRESLLLPEIKSKMGCIMDRLFGYDPVENQYKVVCMIISLHRGVYYHVFTLGDPKKQWRYIGFERDTYPNMTIPSVCINGKIYFVGGNSLLRVERLMRFDVRSERFDQGETPIEFNHGEERDHSANVMTLVNYQGKLGCISKIKDTDMWVMGDDNNIEKQEWSKVTIFISPLLKNVTNPTRIDGVTTNGEIVIMPMKWSYAENLYAYFYDPKKNKTRRIPLMKKLEYQSEYSFGLCIPDHVENAMSLLD